MKDKERSYKFYQLTWDEDNRFRHFESYEGLKKEGMQVEADRYELVYSGTMNSDDTLDSLYDRFNWEHPADFRGHSMSTSDIVVIHENGKDTAYYVDTFGFQIVPEFFNQNSLAKVEEMLEDDYGMIDGIINNGSKKEKDAEELVDKSDVKPSVRERLEAGKEAVKAYDNAKSVEPKKVRADGREEIS